MNRLNRYLTLMLLLAGMALAGCSHSLVISKVNYSQPIETVLMPDEQGIVDDVEHGLRFNIKPLQYAETKDTASVTVNQIRMIRGQQGYYYIIASGFKNVYVMAPDKEKLMLENKIKISEIGIDEPALNQRNPYVELINRETGKTYAISSQGIIKDESKSSDKESGQS